MTTFLALWLAGNALLCLLLILAKRPGKKDQNPACQNYSRKAG